MIKRHPLAAAIEGTTVDILTSVAIKMCQDGYATPEGWKCPPKVRK